MQVTGRYWCAIRQQWVGVGFTCMEDAEEWQTDNDIQLEGLRDRAADSLREGDGR